MLKRPDQFPSVEGVYLMTRMFVMLVLVGVTMTSALACKKTSEEPKPAAEVESAQPAEPAPTPDKPET
jgi:hypothetical protein